MAIMAFFIPPLRPNWGNLARKLQPYTFSRTANNNLEFCALNLDPDGIVTDETASQPTAIRPKRRPRYPGRNPRRFEEKYKEHNPQRYADTVEKVLASGKTPAGTHR